ncbi:MAG: Ni/Fe hydrogenase subunit alpha [Deltaproteobacteria bacterium]|nr:Ni/Fe hydrogenase subunit alpha [Deltaproteobacteria bacterium]
MSQTIIVDPVTRIEGHAKVLLDLDDGGKVKSAGLVVNELRGFERILVGMQAATMPAVTARICGVCPSAHAIAAAKAIDAATHAEVPVAGHLLRELLYMGHVIHSHAVHLFALAGPDLLFGVDSDPAKRNIVGIVEAHPVIAKKALRLRSLGQKINETLGGRGVHPVTVVAGGLSFVPTPERMASVTEMATEALALVQELAPPIIQALLALLEKSPQLAGIKQETAYLGTVRNGKLNLYDGTLRLVGADGKILKEFAAAAYAEHLVEHTYDWSYMKPVFAKVDGKEVVYRVGPLARVNLADGMETPLADAALTAFRAQWGRVVHVTALQEHARLIELLYACEKAVLLAKDPAARGNTLAPVTFTAGRGVAHVEAPRGTLLHDYQVDAAGVVRSANLIVATQHNYAAINRSLTQSAEALGVKGPADGNLLNGLEYTIRTYDPCLSCATHAVGRMPMQVSVRKDGVVLYDVRRDS